MADKEPLDEKEILPADFRFLRAPIRVIAQLEAALLEAKGQYIKDLLSKEAELSPKTRAVLRYCVNDRANREATSSDIMVNHDPEVVFERLTAFEQAVSDPDQLVILPATRTSKTPKNENPQAEILHGDINYELDDFRFWKITVADSPLIHLGNITRAVYKPADITKAYADGTSLENTPLIGLETIQEYLFAESRRILSEEQGNGATTNAAAFVNLESIVALLESKGIKVSVEISDMLERHKAQA